MASYKPTQGMVEEAERGLAWRREHGRGGTEVGIARARDISNGKSLSESTVKRMFSFFSRHEVDKQAEGFSQGEDGYPSNGRIAWALWGGDAGFTWSKGIVDILNKEDERQFRELSAEVRKGLQKKADDHNAEYGDTPSKRTSVRTLAAVFRRGVGAYKTNPQSVRPSVKSPEQWAYARVNSYLYALRNGKFKGGKHDTDLLPSGHPMSTKDRSIDCEVTMAEIDEQRHIKNVEETNDEYIVTFAKAEDEPAMEVEMETEDRFDRSTLTFRQAEFDGYDDEDERSVRMSLSSELPVDRSFGREVLEHSEEAIDMSRLASGYAPLLLDHDMTKQIGVIRKAYLDKADKRLRAEVKFSKSPQAQIILDDIKDGIRSNVSIGYVVRNMVADDANGTVRVNDWQPYEASIVSVPADAGVGIGRSANFVETPKVKEIEMTEVNTDEIREAAKTEALREFQKNAQEITALGARHNKRDLADQAIADGLSIAEFRGVLLDALPEGKPLEQSVGAVDLNEKEQRDYSFMKAVRGLVNGSGLNGLEREVSDEIAKRQGREARGFYAPDSFWTGKRDLTKGTNSAGGFLVGTDHLGNEFVDALRARLVFSDLGARFMTGLKGNVAIPKLATGVSAGFVAENGATSEVNATFAQIEMSPKSLGAFTDISRLLMIQSDPSVEQVVRDDLLNAIAQKIEDVAIEGGASNEPTGITGTSGIGSVAIGTNGGAPTWQSVTDLVKEVEIDNAAINANTLAFLTNAKVKSKMASTAKVSSTDSVMILNEPWDSLYGYPLAVTNNVPSDLTKGTSSGVCSANIFGDFSQLMLGFFSTADVLVDPYTGGSSGAVRIRVMQEVDVAVRHAQSFAACLDYTTT